MDLPKPHSNDHSLLVLLLEGVGVGGPCYCTSATTDSQIVLNVVQSVMYIGVSTNKTKTITNFI
jgi:hypothetical protein